MFSSVPSASIKRITSRTFTPSCPTQVGALDRRTFRSPLGPAGRLAARMKRSVLKEGL
jgi:hypothetical protein